MMINNDGPKGGFWKGITVEQMAAALPKLPPGCLIGVNRVGNLMVCDREGKYLGWIDLGDDGSWHPTILA